MKEVVLVDEVTNDLGFDTALLLHVERAFSCSFVSKVFEEWKPVLPGFHLLQSCRGQEWEHISLALLKLGLQVGFGLLIFLVLSNKRDGMLYLDLCILQLLQGMKISEVLLEVRGVAVGLVATVARVSAVLLDVLQVLSLKVGVLEGDVSPQINICAEAQAAPLTREWLV